jgi:Mlc titration factor MtfA (ptsG expression regulator)
MRREEAALRRRAIPDDLWKRTLVRFPFLQHKSDPGAGELRRLTSLFLDDKEFTTTGGLKLTDAMAVAIAAQAVLPVLRLGLARYDGFCGVVVHADQVVAQREFTDTDGVVHAYEEVLSGEAADGGPVMLSWRDVRSIDRSAGPAYNVVIHEFAHVLDMANGGANGCPQLPPDLAPDEWEKTARASYTAFVQRVDANEASVLDAYGAQSEAEFFAVASEAFFVNGCGLQEEQPALYALLKRFYKQDPAAEQPDRGG